MTSCDAATRSRPASGVARAGHGQADPAEVVAAMALTRASSVLRAPSGSATKAPGGAAQGSWDAGLLEQRRCAGGEARIGRALAAGAVEAEQPPAVQQRPERRAAGLPRQIGEQPRVRRHRAARRREQRELGFVEHGARRRSAMVAPSLTTTIAAAQPEQFLEVRGHHQHRGAAVRRPRAAWRRSSCACRYRRPWSARRAAARADPAAASGR